MYLHTVYTITHATDGIHSVEAIKHPPPLPHKRLGMASTADAEESRTGVWWSGGEGEEGRWEGWGEGVGKGGWGDEITYCTCNHRAHLHIHNVDAIINSQPHTHNVDAIPHTYPIKDLEWAAELTADAGSGE